MRCVFRRFTFLCILSTLAAGSGLGEPAPSAPPGWSDSTTAHLETQYLELLTQLDPVRATLLGLHGGDDTLGPAGRTGWQAARARWQQFADRLEARVDSTQNPDDRFDLLLMTYDIRRRLFEADTLRTAARDPRLPMAQVASGVYGLLVRDYAPLPTRTRALVQRLLEVPTYLDASYRELESPPRVLVEQTLSRADAVSTLLLDELPTLTAGLTDTALTASLSEAANVALQAVWRYRELMVVEIMPRATDQVALGPDLLARTLRASEGITTPLPVLRTRAEREIARLERAFAETAGRIDSTLSPRDVMFRMSLAHPEPDSILATVRGEVNEARRFVAADRAFPPVEAPRIEIRATPQFSRWGTASLASPGPFEKPGFPALFYVTLPDPLAGAGEQAELLRFLSRPLLANVAVHEAFPGHGYQAAWQANLARPARRAITSTLFVEGWAHYTEMLMLDRGYRKGDLSFRLATLQSALRRAARMRVVLGLHAEGWTLDQAAAYFEKHAYLEPSVARREAERTAVDPMALVYTVGRLDLEALRKDMQAREGDRFDLRRFHRRLLDLGAPPIPLARARLLSPEVLGPRFLD